MRYRRVTRHGIRGIGAALASAMALGLAGCAGTPAAERLPQPERVAAAATAEAAGRGGPVTCEDVQAAGSRMTKRVCRTAAEVAADRASAKATLAEYRRIGRVRGAKW